MIKTKHLHLLAIASVALAASFVIVANAYAQTSSGARVAGRTANAAFAGQRGVVSDGQGNVDAGAASTFTTVNGSHGQRTARVSRSADGTASAERNTSADQRQHRRHVRRVDDLHEGLRREPVRRRAAMPTATP